MSAPLIFLDTETTGLSLDDDIWEFAAIRREPDGTEIELHRFIEHNEAKCKQLPESFLADHLARFPGHNQATRRARAAYEISVMLEPTRGEKVHVVGAVPNFDTERIALLLRQFGHEPSWHYHLIDVETLAVGWLRGVAEAHADRNRLEGTPRGHDPAEIAALVIHQLPWRSDDLSRACEVEPPGEGERHTAMADARWAMRLYDRIVGGA